MTTSPPPTMTPERWRAVDQILQGALICTRDHRDEFVAHSCGNDTALRNEVSSLLAAYDATPLEFLERPAIEEHGFDSATMPATPPVPATSLAQPRRMVSARLVLYAAGAGIFLGTITGWNLAHSSTIERWQTTLRAIRQQANANGAASST